MHNSRLLVSVGQVVKQGDANSNVWKYGELSGGPHLHFGVMLNGEYVDPLDYVDPRQSKANQYTTRCSSKC